MPSVDGVPRIAIQPALTGPWVLWATGGGGPGPGTGGVEQRSTYFTPGATDRRALQNFKKKCETPRRPKNGASVAHQAWCIQVIGGGWRPLRRLPGPTGRAAGWEGPRPLRRTDPFSEALCRPETRWSTSSGPGVGRPTRPRLGPRPAPPRPDLSAFGGQIPTDVLGLEPQCARCLAPRPSAARSFGPQAFGHERNCVPELCVGGSRLAGRSSLWSASEASRRRGWSGPGPRRQEGRREEHRYLTGVDSRSQT